MPILAPCEQCERKVRIDHSLAGKRIACPACDNVIITPELEKTPELADTENQEKSASEVPVVRPVPDSTSERPLIPDPFQTPSTPTNHRFIEPDKEPHQGHLLFALSMLSFIVSLAGGLGILMSIYFWRVAANDLQKITEGEMDPEGEAMTFNSMMFNMANIVIFGFVWVVIYLFVLLPMLLFDLLG